MNVEIYRKGLKKKKIGELRLMMHNAKEHTMEQLGYIITEYKLRIPYCEVCGNKAPIFTTMRIVDEKDNTIKMKVCVSCHKLLGIDAAHDGYWFVD